MQTTDKYYNSQLEAIQDFYKSLQQEEHPEVSLSEAIITWFANGYAEKFRQEYLNSHALFTNN